MSSQNEKQTISGQDKDDILEKLNRAMSSCFNDEQDRDISGTPRNISKLLEELGNDIVTSELAQDHEDDTPIAQEHEDTIPIAQEHEVAAKAPVSQQGSPFIIPAVHIDPGLFSDVEYQSVDIIMTKEEKPVSVEDSTVYSKIVADALKAAPRQKVETVLIPDMDNVARSKPHEKKRSEDISNDVTEITKIKSAGPKKEHKIATSIKDPAPDTVSPSSKGHETARGTNDRTSSASKIAFIHNPRHTEHEPASLSVKTFEVPDRINKAMWYLEKKQVFSDEGYCLIEKGFQAKEEDLLRAHDKAYIQFIQNYASNGGGFLGDSTYITPKSFEIAKLSAGAAIHAGDLVADGKFNYAFVMSRPPGHHAGRSRYGGFCLLNNAAILARYLQTVKGMQKALILDWDAHAGDGTMEIFYDDPSVLTVSLHRDPHGFYPRKGFVNETGTGAGEGYSVNVEMPAGAGDEEYLFAFEEVVVPLIERFMPDIIICACGFDAHYKEKNIGMNLSSEGFYGMTNKLISVYNKGLVFLMEGGYHDFNGQLCHSVLSALQGKPNPINDRLEVSSFKKEQQKKILEDTKERVEQVKKVIPLLF